MVCRNRELVRATTFVKPGGVIDPGTGGAKDNVPRFVEMAWAGLPSWRRPPLDLPNDGDAANSTPA